MIPFSATISPTGVLSFTHHDGRVYQVTPDFNRYHECLNLVRELSHEPENEEKRQELFETSQPRFLIAKSSDGRITIQNGQVVFDGQPAEEFVAKRLLAIIDAGMNPEPIYNFMVNLQENPSHTSVTQLYRFMEANDMAITPSGMILAYKRVTNDYKDIYTNTLDNRVGQIVRMVRNQVNDDPHVTCSSGLHVCSINYLPHYGASHKGNRVVICEIHPRDVVSVPVDYHNAKMRVSSYRVVDELTDIEDILGSSPVIDAYDEIVGDFDFNEMLSDNVQQILSILGDDTLDDVGSDPISDWFGCSHEEFYDQFSTLVFDPSRLSIHMTFNDLAAILI